MKLKNKKTQGLSLNTIIIAALVLVVLIVLWAIFTGRMGKFSSGLNECRGKCMPESQCQPPSVNAGGDCDEEESAEEGTKISDYGYNILNPIKVAKGKEEGKMVCCIELK